MKSMLEVIHERLESHMQDDEKAWKENGDKLDDMNIKLTVVCTYIAEQKAQIRMAKYMAGIIGAGFAFFAEKLWRM